MKFVSNKDNLTFGVHVCQRAVSSKNPLPVLSGIFLKTEDGKLTFTATDLEIGIECIIPVNTIENGSVVLPARIFSEIVKRLPDVPIEMDTDKSNFSTLLKYAQSEFNLLGISPDDFPILPSIDNSTPFVIKQELFKDMIRQVIFATSSDDHRPIFTGILMELEGENLKLIATDTHRLAFRKGRIENAHDVQKSVVIPGKTLNELSRIMNGEGEDLNIYFGDNQVVFEMPGRRLISRLIEGQFPNYRQVIPEGCKTQIRLKTRELLDAVERASLLAKEGSNYIKISVSQGKMVINSNSPEIGKIEEQLNIVFEGEDTQIAFNSKYLIDVLKAIDSEEVLLELTGSLSPGMIKPVGGENYIYIILPVRIV